MNQPLTEGELQALRRSVQRGTPFGSTTWQKRTAGRLGLEWTLRPRGRPRKTRPPRNELRPLVQTYSREAITTLYRERWFAELDLRSIKSTMQLDILRCKTPEMARVELQTGILAYNLIRQSILQAAVSTGCLPRELSFTSAMQTLASNWVTAAVCDDVPQTLIDLIVSDLSSHKVGNRPNRVEPRAVKRRPRQYDHLAQPRREARAALIHNRSS